MRNIPITEETTRIASRLIWFKTPEKALNDPYTFLAYVMTNGTLQDISTIKKILGMAVFEETLMHMPAGIMDERSWVYWNTICGKSPSPPLPQRNL